MSQAPPFATLLIYVFRSQIMRLAEVVFEIVVSLYYGAGRKAAINGHLKKIDRFNQVVELVKFLRKADNRHCQKESQRERPQFQGQGTAQVRTPKAVFSHSV